jgi:hypothetical protein
MNKKQKQREKRGKNRGIKSMKSKKKDGVYTI